MGWGGDEVLWPFRMWLERTTTTKTVRDRCLKKKRGGGSECKVPYQLWFVFFASAPVVFSDIQHPPWRRRGGTASVPTLPTAEQGSPPSTKLLYAKRIAVVCDQLKYVPWFCLPEILFFFFFTYYLAFPSTTLYCSTRRFWFYFFCLFVFFPIRWSCEILSFFFPSLSVTVTNFQEQIELPIVCRTTN